jgi:glycosyltransferase involved in cell wall biosynthesis
VAVVASDVGQQVTEVIRDGENGLLAEPGAPDSLAMVINQLIANPELRKNLGKCAREDAINKYSWDSYLQRLEYVYAAILKKLPINQI